MAVNPCDLPIRNASGRYDNVDFRRATGFHYPPIKCSYNRRDVLLFANAIGVQSTETHFLYELDPQFAPFPTFPVNLAFKQRDQDVFDFVQRTTSTSVPGVPPADAQRSVDGERGIEILHPLPTSSDGLDLEIQAKVLGVYDKGGHMILEAEQTLIDVQTDRVYARMSSTAFCIDQGGYNGPRGPTRPTASQPHREPDAVHVFATTPEQSLLYRLCGDYNPLHADDQFGRRAGFKGKILQGLGTWNIAAHGILQKLAGSNPNQLKSFSARFKSVVYPGDVLETRMWREASDTTDEQHVIFITIVRGDGRVALSNGRAILKTHSVFTHKL